MNAQWSCGDIDFSEAQSEDNKVHSKCENMFIQIWNKSKDDHVVILQHFVKQRH